MFLIYISFPAQTSKLTKHILDLCTFIYEEIVMFPHVEKLQYINILRKSEYRQRRTKL